MNKARTSHASTARAWLERLLPGNAGQPQSKDELVELLKQARDRALFDTDALTMMEGVLQVADLRVRDIMIPRAQMVVMERDAPFAEILAIAIESSHSRFPVIGDDRGEVVGILLAKDLLQYCGERGEQFNIRDVLRSAVFVPESKRLNVLLKEFRASRNHMAIVVDEYGAAAGLVTIEDVLEQIVGEIEDEYDFDEGAYIFKRGPGEYTAKGHTSIEDFNEFFGSELDDSDFDTISGLVVNAIGHLPKKGESVELEGFRFTVIRADSRKVKLLNVQRLGEPPADSGD